MEDRYPKLEIERAVNAKMRELRGALQPILQYMTEAQKDELNRAYVKWGDGESLVRLVEALVPLYRGTPMPSENVQPLDLVGPILDFESGELDTENTLKLFAGLVKTGLAWKLQGSYGRAAQHLIDDGFITAEGTVTEKGEALYE